MCSLMNTQELCKYCNLSAQQSIAAIKYCNNFVARGLAVSFMYLCILICLSFRLFSSLCLVFCVSFFLYLYFVCCIVN